MARLSRSNRHGRLVLAAVACALCAACTTVESGGPEGGAADTPHTGFASLDASAGEPGSGGDGAGSDRGGSDAGGLADALPAGPDAAWDDGGGTGGGPGDGNQPAADGDAVAAGDAGPGLDGGASDGGAPPADATPDGGGPGPPDTPGDLDGGGSDVGGSTPEDSTDSEGIADGADAPSGPAPSVCDPGWVTLEPAGLRLDGQPWTPRMLDHRVTIRVAGPARFVAPAGSGCGDAAQCAAALADDLTLAAEIGFDAVRFGGLPWAHDATGVELACETPCVPLDLATDAGRASALTLLTGLVDSAEDAGLRALLVTREPHDDPKALAPGEAGWLEALGAGLADRQALFAFDLAPEPGDPTLLFELGKGPRITGLQARYDALRAGTPTQLITATVRGAEAAIDWDPALLPVDLVGLAAFPPPEAFEGNARLAYEREAVWLAGAGAPWLTASTGLPTGGDATETDQHAVALRAHELVRDCGGLGLGWFRLRDQQDDFGLIRADGSLKPAAAVFATFDADGTGGACPTLAELKTPATGPGFSVTGRVLSTAGVPIGGAVVVGWSCVDPALRSKALTGSDGKYTLHTAAATSHVAISSPGHETLEQLWTSCSSVDLGDRILGAWTGVQPATSAPTCAP